MGARISASRRDQHRRLVSAILCWPPKLAAPLLPLLRSNLSSLALVAWPSCLLVHLCEPMLATLPPQQQLVTPTYHTALSHSQHNMNRPPLVAPQCLWLATLYIFSSLSYIHCTHSLSSCSPSLVVVLCAQLRFAPATFTYLVHTNSSRYRH